MNGHSTAELTVKMEKITMDPIYSGREGQVACTVPNSQRVYVFGGVEQGHVEEPTETNDLFLFDLQTTKWSKVATTGTVPAARSAASLVAVGTKLYLFGGLSHVSGWFDDLFVFDTETNVWSPVGTEGTKPRARDKLQAVAIDANIYYFGGFGPKTDEAEVDDLVGSDDDDEDFEDIPESKEQQGAEFGWFNDLYILDTETLKWSQPMQMNLGVPTQRAAHGMCAIGRNLVIFGGRDIEDRQNDLHIFNIDTRKWATEMQVSGRVPEPRSFHTLTAVAGKAVLFGGRGRNDVHFDGFDVFDIDTKSWTQVKMEGDKPGARGQHCAVTVGDSLLVFGGSGNFSQDTMQCQTFYTDAFLVKAGMFAGKVIQNGHGDS